MSPSVSGVPPCPAQAGCYDALQQCEGYQSLCQCQPAYLTCLASKGCSFLTVEAAVTACENDGCAVSQCAPSLRQAMHHVRRATNDD